MPSPRILSIINNNTGPSKKIYSRFSLRLTLKGWETVEGFKLSIEDQLAWAWNLFKGDDFDLRKDNQTPG